jgi:hypothetical protein
MGTTKAAKVPALKLTLGGAPATWHSVDGLHRLLPPRHPHPVGGPASARSTSPRPPRPTTARPSSSSTSARPRPTRPVARDGEQVTDAARALRDGYGATRQQVDATIEALAGPGAADINDDDEED